MGRSTAAATMKNVVAIRVGPRDSTPELREALCKASVKAVRDKLTEHSRISAKTWIYIGKELIGTKAAAEKDGPTVFAGLFAKSAADRSEARRYPFSLRAGYMLMAIAELCEPVVHKDSLPASWRTLYELSRIPSEKLSELIDSGAVHPMMTRADAMKLAAPEKKKAAARKKPDRTEQVYRAAQDLFTKISDQDQRAAEFLNLMHDCGITLEQLQRATK